MKARSTLLLAAAAASLLVSCGNDDGDSSDLDLDSPFGDVPACSDVWEVGATLDLDTYEGCQDGDTVVAAVTRGCYDDDDLQYVGQVATFDDSLWVVQEGTDQTTGEGGRPGQVTDVDPKC